MSSDQEGNRDKDLSTRVNASRLPDYIGQNVRLPCRILKVDGAQITVETSDGGQVTVSVLPNTDISDPFLEIIGKVLTPTSVQMFACVKMGSELDMKLVNDTIELIHDPRFYQKMFR
ncbi:hypothetical protein GALMADRAFT_242278 [Galerina marginata CBS 339.88]|uniref:Replication factor A protein 3 n=1 Tax=Galerina marginata (strain CBS 339.88) TaxID=685588 RepID=A0A067TM79_GALM3|nr:hypothetical protein GALMADRAFT_242278 [Galerina marginata CBS 339.88]